MARIYDDVDPAYAATCSDATVCSNKKGFFKNISEELVAMAEEDNWIETFENIADGEKVASVMENKMIMDALGDVLSRIQPMFRGKDVRVSSERRMEANTALQEGDLKKSLALASQAVLRAPMTGMDEVLDNGISLAMALWLRSEILLKSNRPKAALEDLKLALKERLPARMRAQYYWRMGLCYKGTCEPTRAKVSYELAGRLLGNNGQLKEELFKDMEALDYSMQPENITNKPGISLTGGSKLNTPSLSKLVKVVEEAEKGRFVIANEHIKTGDVLLVDNPYAACLLSEYYGSHCLHCFKRFDSYQDEAPVWCTKCSGVAFCNIKCRDDALSTYHPYECQFLDLFTGSGMSILCHIALRMITQAGLETSLLIHSKFIKSEIKTVEGANLNDIEGVAKKSRIKSRKERLNRTKKGLKNFLDRDLHSEETGPKIEDKMSYHEKLEATAAQIYSLCAHSRRRRGADYLTRIIMAMFLTECLKKSGFFKNCGKENISKAEVSVCELITQNLQLLQFNAHEIYETVRVQHQLSGSKPIYVAVGIYPTGALFNHECYPAVARYFEGQKIVLRATRPLAAGEVVSENYGPHFLMRSLKERQRSLACRYWFKCDCIPCREDWPTLKQMHSDSAYFRCPNINCSGKFRVNAKCSPNNCSKCSEPINKDLMKMYLETMNKCLQDYQKGANLIEENNIEEATEKFTEAVDSYYEVARPPHRETHIAQESLRSCFALSGNVYNIQKELENK